MNEAGEHSMMRKILPIILFLLTNSVIGQSNNEDKVNQKDENNLKQGHWVITNENGQYDGYKEGQVVEEGDYLDNKKVGVWIKYFPNGNKKHELTFVNNRPHGYAKFYYENGRVREEGMWENNHWVGEYKFYHENGRLYYDWNYNSKGKREGEQKYFHENGHLMITGDWKNGKEAGKVVTYYDDGSVKSEKVFDEGKIRYDATKSFEKAETFDENKDVKSEPVITVMQETKGTSAKVGLLEDGYNKTYNNQRQLLKEGYFKNQKLINGKEYIYDNDGDLHKTITYKDGKKVDEEVMNN